MSDFKGVMRQWTRMCKHYYNDGWCADECRLKETSLCYMHNSRMADKDFDDIEQIVMTWAVANPESVYPTWAEWLTEIGLFEETHSMMIYRDADAGLLNHLFVNTKKIHEPIPADIAERLGVKPKTK